VKGPALFAVAWGVVSAGAAALATEIVRDCPMLASPEYWPVYLTAFSTAAVGKYLHSGRPKV